MPNPDPYLNPKLSITERVDDLLSRMTLAEKVGQMCQYLLPEKVSLQESPEANSALHSTQPALTEDIDDSTMRYDSEHQQSLPALIRRGLIGSILSVTDPERVNQAQAIAEESRLGIPLLFGIDAIHGNAMHHGATVYPAPIGLAATWDPELVRRVAKATALEMRACNLHWTFSPNLDVLRDGRWGRSGETAGEDPYLVAKIGLAMIEGYQDTSNPDEYVMACGKHYIAGGEPSNGINFAAMDMSERALREVYLPPFAAAVAAQVDTIMAAHNEVNGVPCHCNHYLMSTLLRGELGFDGFVVSDFTDISRLFTLHRVATSVQDADRQAIEAGIDMHMHGPGFLEEVIDLVEREVLDEALIDKAVRSILAAKFKLGLFEQRYVDTARSASQIATPQHRALALESARKSIVLLKNNGGTLPLSRKLDRVFITGPLANTQAILGDWAVEQPEDNVVTVLQGIQATVSEDTSIEFLDCGPLLKISDNTIAMAHKRATEADVAVVVVGENALRTTPDKTEGENVPRASLALPGRQQALVESIIASGTPTAIILINGRPQAIPWIADHASAIIEAFHPGMCGGLAIAEVLFGITNPAGRLPYTVPRSVGQLRAIYNHRPSDYFRQYQDAPNAPLYQFGFGLSYTHFIYNEVTTPAVIKAGQDVPVTISITNTGDYTGDEVVIVYLHDEFSSVTQPVKEVAAFERITLKPGESKTLTLTIAADQLALYNRELKRTIEPGDFTVMVGKQVARFTVED